MNLKTFLTFFISFVFHMGFGQSFKPEKLIGNWEVKYSNVELTYEFVDASHVNIYNNKHVKTEDSPLIWTLENITASGFMMRLNIAGDADKSHASKTKCKWVSDSRFTAAPAQPIAGGNVTMIFTRKK